MIVIAEEERGGIAAELRVSAIIPAHNEGRALSRCIQALCDASPSPDETIVVVDGGCAELVQIADALGAQVILLSPRGGPASARNVGAWAARGDVLLFVDADVLVPCDAIALIRSVLSRSPRVAALFGSYDDAPEATGFLSQCRNLFHHYVHQTAREEASTFWAGCGAIRREAYLELGGFDERYRRPSVEDIELGLRLKHAGYRIRLCKELQAKHLKAWDALTLLRTDLLDRAIPWSELIMRDRALVNDLNLRTASRISVIAAFSLGAALLAALAWSPMFAVAALAVLVLVALNARLYRFFTRKRGLSFAAGGVVWHWCYFVFCGLGFALGAAKHVFRRHEVTRWPNVLSNQDAG